MIALRMASKAIRTYGADPEGRENAVRVLLLNAVRLCVHHLGAREAGRIVLMALPQDIEQRAQQ